MVARPRTHFWRRKHWLSTAIAASSSPIKPFTASGACRFPGPSRLLWTMPATVSKPLLAWVSIAGATCTWNSASNPAPADAIVSLSLTGAGLTDRVIPDGVPASEPLPAHSTASHVDDRKSSFRYSLRRRRRHPGSTVGQTSLPFPPHLVLFRRIHDKTRLRSRQPDRIRPAGNPETFLSWAGFSSFSRLSVRANGY